MKSITFVQYISMKIYFFIEETGEGGQKEARPEEMQKGI